MAQGSRYSSALREAFIGSESDILMKTLEGTAELLLPLARVQRGPRASLQQFHHFAMRRDILAC